MPKIKIECLTEPGTQPAPKVKKERSEAQKASFEKAKAALAAKRAGKK